MVLETVIALALLAAPPVMQRDYVNAKVIVVIEVTATATPQWRVEGAASKAEEQFALAHARNILNGGAKK